MICLYIELNNYGGIFNGLHLNNIYIDFRKCKHKVILLKGDSGSGKSTIIESISPLPEDNEYFIPGMPAYKKIGYLDESTGITYDIFYNHDIKPNGDRATTKGYITKRYPDGNVQELNPTGNITPCKEMIYSEFELDPNFIALTKMNTTDKGLVDKTPSARKAYVNSILSTTQAYNEIYKKINKKASTYKDRIKRISGKIDAIGNPEKIRIQLEAVEANKQAVAARIDKLTEAIARADAAMTSIDSKGTVTDRYNEILARLKEIQKLRTSLISNLDGKESHDSYAQAVTILNEAIPNINTEISKCDVRTESLLKDREYDSQSLESKIAKLESCSDANLDNIKDEIERIKSEIETCNFEIHSLGLDGIIDCIPERFNTVHSICSELTNLFHGSIPEEIVSYLFAQKYLFDEMEASRKTLGSIPQFGPDINFGSVIPKNLVSCTPEEASTKSINQIEAEYSQYLALLSSAELLKKRPTTCGDSTCPFIKNAIDAQAEIDRRGYTSEEYEAEIQEWRSLATMMKIHNQAKMYAPQFFSTIAKKFTEVEQCRDIFEMLGMFVNDTVYDACFGIYGKRPEYNLDNIMKAKQGVSNIFTLRHKFIEQLESLDGQMSDYKTKNALYMEISNDIDKLRTKIESTINESKQLAETKQNLENKLREANDKLYEAKRYLNDYETLDALNIENDTLEKEKSTIEADAIKYTQAVEFIDKASRDKVTLGNELKNLELQQSELNYNSRMISSYTEELDSINTEYKRIELIKYYTSPSSTGIQTIFAAMYMNDIVIQANQILGGLFNGELTIMPFIIDESEFRIPIARLNGIPLDDVKSLSGGQTALVSMIISFALVHKSSSKLNILTADELDGPLDPALRRQFIDTLYTVLQMVGSNQAILISHNSEMPMSECDVVLLKNDNADGASIGGNVIWSYYNQTV